MRSAKLTFVAERPPPPQLADHEFLMAAETRAIFFHDLPLD